MGFSLPELCFCGRLRLSKAEKFFLLLLLPLDPPSSDFTFCFSLQTLKRKEKEYEHEMERLAREKIATQQRLAELKNELSQWMDVLEIDRIIRQTVQPEDDQASTSTASGMLGCFGAISWQDSIL